MRKTNKTLLKKDIDEITIQTFRDAVFLCYKIGITSIAPLGCSGDTILLHGDEENGRESVVSIRNYSGDAELLITDKQGKFLFYGIFSIDLNVDFVVNQYWAIFQILKNKINTDVENISEFKKLELLENCELSEGFEILRHFQEVK